jgi:hypothetical protein
MDIRTQITRLMEKHGLKRFSPASKRVKVTLRSRIKGLFRRYVRRVKHKNFAYYTGQISLLHPITDLLPGHIVVTPFGIGTVKYRFPIRGLKMFRNKMVEVWLKKKYYRAFSIEAVYQYFVYHPLMDTHIPIMPDCYQYIIGEGDTVEYRITDRGYADLSDKEKHDREYVAIFSNKRGGRALMKELLNKGFIIKRHGKHKNHH